MDNSAATKLEQYRRYRNTFLALFIAIVILERIIAMTVTGLSGTGALVSNIMVIVISWGLSIATCYFWVQIKTLNKWLTFLGFVPLIGFIILASIKEKA